MRIPRSPKTRQAWLTEALDLVNDDEWEGEVETPYHTVPRDYRGLVLETNDHGNVTLWMQYANGNRREIASMV